jgi:hypothetical protein
MLSNKTTSNAQGVLEGVVGVGGKLVPDGIAGALSGDSAGTDEPEVETGAVCDAPVFPLPRDEGVNSLLAEVGASAPNPEVVRRLVVTTSSMAMSIQTVAVITVILVNVSPALVPNALDPPTPPKAPARPPPLPRWIKIRQIKKMEAMMISVLKIAVSTPTRVVL